MNKLKIFVWEDVLSDYTPGIVCIFAESLEQAFEILYLKDSLAWFSLQNITVNWNDKHISELCKIYPKDNLMQLQKRHFDSLEIKVSSTYKKPKIITEPEAFVVWGGG